MNTASTLALAALTFAGALSAGPAHAYMGDGCGPHAQARISRHTGQVICRPIVRAPVAVVPVAPMVPAFPRIVMPGFGGYGGPVLIHRQGPIQYGGYRGGMPGPGRVAAPVGRVGHPGHVGHPGMTRGR